MPQNTVSSHWSHGIGTETCENIMINIESGTHEQETRTYLHKF